ncbi:hypothetical protein TNCT1_36320 [Streptomyces sp. 1-11]|nr:hypothetical protein TNCT1_36320 [Streptomyces sp. 1-11]
MRYIKLGTTGLEVSAIALGCMSFGEPDRGGEPWSLGVDASRDIIKQALESGVNFLDTANGYSAGSSEEIVGQAVKDFTRREEVVLPRPTRAAGSSTVTRTRRWPSASTRSRASGACPRPRSPWPGSCATRW